MRGRDAEAGLLKVVVLGSCTTRDNFNSRFNPHYRQLWDCVYTQMQASIISLMSPGFEIADDRYGDISDYKKSVVRKDLTKEFLNRIVELAPDVLVLDFFGDIHFGCLKLEDGRYITNNRWHLWHTDYYKDLIAAGNAEEVRIENDPEAYLVVWKESFDRLAAYLRENCPATTVVVHYGFNTDRVLVAGSRAPIPLLRHKKVKKMDVPLMNRLWAELDEYATRTTGYDAIDLVGRGFTTSSDHPWGPFYVHYTMDYYRDFLAELNAISLEHRLASRGAEFERAMLRSVVEAFHARSDEDRAKADAEHEHLRRRLKARNRELAEARTGQVEPRSHGARVKDVLTRFRRGGRDPLA